MQTEFEDSKVVCKTVLFLKTAQILLTLSTLMIILIISMALLINVWQAEFSIPVTLRNCCKCCTVWLT